MALPLVIGRYEADDVADPVALVVVGLEPFHGGAGGFAVLLDAPGNVFKPSTMRHLVIW